MPHKKIIRRQSSSRISSSTDSFHDKLRWLTLCLLCLAIFNFTVLHLVQSTIIDFYGVESSLLSFSEDLIASWDPTSYSDDKSILPKKIITVIGKESSGTTFVAKTIGASLGLPGRQKYRDGFFHQERRAYDELPIQVQHVSLPQGAWCLQNHSHHIVDVILPPHCVSGKNGKFPSQTYPGIRRQCEALLNGTVKNGIQLYEGMMEMHGPWFLKRQRKREKVYYKAGRYPGRSFAQSALVRSRNVTRVKPDRRRERFEERMERREEQRNKERMERREQRNQERMERHERRDRHREQLLKGAFETVDAVPEPRNSGEDPPPLVIQRGEDMKRRVLKEEEEQERVNSWGNDGASPFLRRLGEVTDADKDEVKKGPIKYRSDGGGEVHRAKDADKEVKKGRIKYRFDGGEVHQVKDQSKDGNAAAAADLHANHHHPPKHRAFRHDMSSLSQAQQDELKRRMRIADGHALPEDGPADTAAMAGQGRAETPNERLRRENQERKHEMMRREREESFRRMHHSGGSNDDGPRLHGKRPPRQSRQQRTDEWVNRLKLHPMEELHNNNLLMYPNRFLLNITAQKIWYDAHGTEQVIVIVVRDPKMSLKSRLKSHCHIVELAKEEENIANAILNDAIQTFFLNDKSGFNSGFDGRWYGKTVEEIQQEAFLWDPTPIIENREGGGDPLYSSRIPISNNVVLVSYEAMMKYKQDYVSELYKVLGIQSDYHPVFKDGNAKYRNESEAAGSIGRRPPGDMPPYMEDEEEDEEGEDDGHGFFFHWLLEQPEDYQGVLLAIACASVFAGSFSLWVGIFWFFFRRSAKKKKKRKGVGRGGSRR